MSEILFIAIGLSLAYKLFSVIVDIKEEINNKKNKLYDYRDNDEKIIAGEDTSEVALDYLKKL
jgi:hypothetical protein